MEQSKSFPKRWKAPALWLGWLVLLFVAGWLRFTDLDMRALHADEATGARLLAEYVESGQYVFNPKHFHGPLQSFLSAPVARALGAESWLTLDKFMLRILPAITGFLIILTPLLFLRWLKPLGALAAAAFLSTSPLLVYYSRMFIHETLFAMAALLTLAALRVYARRPAMMPALLLGLAVGLMAVVRETFAISVLAWCGAFVVILLEPAYRRGQGFRALLGSWKTYLLHAGVAVVAAMALITLLYTDFLRSPRGVLDFFRTYFVYEVTAGHEKAFPYYLHLLLWPRMEGRVLWGETGLFVFALIGFLTSFTRSERAVEDGPFSVAILARFLGYGIVGHLLIYSLIGYKTPWLMCSVWVQTALLAGFGVNSALRLFGQTKYRGPGAAGLAVALGLVFFWQTFQSTMVLWRYHSHVRNPYAYVPTTMDVERLGSWLGEIRRTVPQMQGAPLAVVGDQYWPLPYYLRGFEKIGYWLDTPPNAEEFPILILMPSAPQELMDSLADTHKFFVRGVRYEVPAIVFIRKDIWQSYKELQPEGGSTRE